MDGVYILVLFAAGIFFLIKGADWIIEAASSLAKRLGVSHLVIGLTVVAFGTTMPELVVNLFSVINGNSEIVFGNIIGSNIANILLILGTVALIGTITVGPTTIWKEIPFALFATFILFLLVARTLLEETTPYLTRMDGLILLSLFGLFLYSIYQLAKKDHEEIKFVEKQEKSKWYQVVPKLVFGTIGLYFGGKWVVNGAVFAAETMGLSEFFISATLVAVGTSLPELIVAIVSVYRKNVDLAVGDIVGSNIFNILWVLGVVPVVRPLFVPSFVLLDIAIMFFVTLFLFIFMFVGKKHELRRKEGAMFLILYFVYIFYIATRG